MNSAQCGWMLIMLDEPLNSWLPLLEYKLVDGISRGIGPDFDKDAGDPFKFHISIDLTVRSLFVTKKKKKKKMMKGNEKNKYSKNLFHFSCE